MDIADKASVTVVAKRPVLAATEQLREDLAQVIARFDDQVRVRREPAVAADDLHVFARRDLADDVRRAQQAQAFHNPIAAHEVRDEVAIGPGQQIIRAAELLDFAVVEQGDAVRHLHRFINVVTDEQYSLVDETLDAHELVLNNFTVDRVDGAEGLVHQHHRWIRSQRPRYADALLLPTGQLTGVALEKLRRIQRDHFQQLGGAFTAFALVPAQQIGHDADVFLDGHVREQADLLDHIADGAFERNAVQFGRVATIDSDGAGRRRDQSVDHFQRRGFATTRGPEQYANLSLFDIE